MVEHDQRRVIGIAATDSQVPEEQVHLLALGFDHLDSEAGSGKFQFAPLEELAGGPTFEAALEGAAHLAGVYIARDGDYGAAGHPIEFVVSAQVAWLYTRHAL
jgi:hypothetical protein